MLLLSGIARTKNDDVEKQDLIYRQFLTRILHKSLPDLTGQNTHARMLLIDSTGNIPSVTRNQDTGFLQEFPCKTNELRDIKANSCNMRAKLAALEIIFRLHDER